jgi:histidine triad (HIT) family protein
MENCLFCKIVKGEIPSQKVYEDADILAFNDIKPQAPVHILIVPKRHIDTFSSLDDGDRMLAGRLLLVARAIAKNKGIDTTGYRLVGNCQKDAGQLVFHIHFHLLGGRAFSWPPG